MLSTAKQQIFLIGFGTFLALFSLVSIILFTDPGQTGWITVVSLYASLFLAALGVLTLLGLLIRRTFRQKLFILSLGHSFRQALLASALMVCSLVLQSYGLLYWWVALSLILFFTFLEAFLNLGI